MNLLDTLMLASLQPLRLTAELKEPLAGDDLQAHVEFRMTPQHEEEPVNGGFEMLAELRCRVTVAAGEERRELLVIEHVARARYQSRPGAAMNESFFRTSHADLGRQLYPLMQQRIAPLFPHFGIAEIRLPLEVVPDKPAAPAGATH
ncbi:MAG: hypothetical protein AAGE01_15565 [Pseudomonadota bacterium]